MALFVSFEGPEGSGKTTQVGLLHRWLTDRGYRVLSTREPGGTRIGDRIREILLDPIFTEMQPQTEILLFSAARAQIVREVIEPHLAQGGIVLCDRFADSTLAYQGYGRELGLDELVTITRFATGGLVPDVTFLLDLDVEEGLQRKAGGKRLEWNRMEQQQLTFHARVRRGYLELSRQDPKRWIVLDARDSPQAIHRQVIERLQAWLALP